MLTICPNREPAGLPIVMQILGGKLKCESVERVFLYIFLYIYVNTKDQSTPNFFLFKYLFDRVRYCVTFIVAVGTFIVRYKTN